MRSKRPKLYDVLCFIAAVYAKELTILQRAYDSAHASDRWQFQEGRNALELLKKLGYSYAYALRDGDTEHNACAKFGKNEIALNEGNELTTKGKAARTIRYEDETILMERHLKRGAKDSVAETLRVHFHWHSRTQKVIIGLCGKHLDR